MKNFKLIMFFVIFSFVKSEEGFNFSWIIADQEAVKIPQSVIGASKKKYSFLNDSSYYKKYQTKKACLEAFSDEIVESTFSVQNNFFNTYYFNRSSSILVIVIPSYGGKLNDLIRFAGIFSNTDLLIIDYNEHSVINPFFPVYSFINAPTEFQRKSRVAQLINILQEVKKQGYQEIIGASQCYGSWVVLDAQISLEASGCVGFDKLVIDSCPSGTAALLEKFIENPVTISTLGKMTGPSWVSAVTKILYYPVRAFAYCLYQDFSVNDFLGKIQVPVLFIHNQKDLLVTSEEFKQMYQSVNHANKASLLTDFKHLEASLKAKELYAEIVSHFIEGILF